MAVGDHLRQWRLRRRLSQQELAHDADLSPRHLSCVETGKASPSRELVLRLCERLAVPLRDRNAWLVAAGYAPCTASSRWTTRRCMPLGRRFNTFWTAMPPGLPWHSIGTGTW